ncbi:sulfotransferase [Altererythrobacter sp. MF3-039]|uniref:sulfotransferase n=1 Tax=Altererythrobacter sp. MF3-039 TaxID=3252901 RepID=UPI00390CA5C3
MSPPRNHPLESSATARRMEAFFAWTWDSGLSEKPPLDPEYLWERGASGFASQDEHSGRSPDDVEDFRQRLEKLCISLGEEADLNALGHAMAYGQLRNAIAKRHRLGKLWRDRPHLLETAIAPPIIVVGQMRSGTTRLHRLLAADPAHAGTMFCNSIEPVPSEPVDWRALKARMALAMARSVNPWLETMHPFGAMRVDEELGWLALSLSPCALEAQYRIPSFLEWSEARDSGPIYHEFARILRVDSALEENADRPRILKCPQFSEDLAALLDQFPDSRLVIARRKQSEMLESSVSMVASQMGCQTDSADVGQIRSEWRRKLALRETRMEQALRTFAGPTSAVDFETLGEDWESEITRVYRELDIELEAAALEAMRAEMAQSTRDGHHGHREQIESFASEN